MEQVEVFLMKAPSDRMPTNHPSSVKRIVPLSKRKKKLPLKFLAPALAMIITLAGVGVATQLSQQSQDVRSDASTAKPPRPGQPPTPGCRSEKTAELWVRTQSRTGDWSSWAGPNTAVDSTGQGLLTSFAMYAPIDGPMGFGSDLTQYAVRGGELWVRTGGLDRNWSSWAGPNTAVNSVGAGALTSFSAISDTVSNDVMSISTASSRTTVVKQYAVKGGQLWVRSMIQGGSWTNWIGPNKAVDSVGTGVLTGFSMAIEPGGETAPNGLLKQYAVKGGQLWVRTSTNGDQWTNWEGPNRAVDPVGGKIISFDAAIDVTMAGSPRKQYATVEKESQVCN